MAKKVLVVLAGDERKERNMQDRKRILVVDDDDSVLFVLSHSLEKLGNEYEIVTAHSGEEALEKFNETAFHLLLTDLKMPGIGGVVLTEAVRALSPSTVVIWMTAYGDQEIEDKARQLQIHRCLSKPLDIDRIRESAQDAIEFAERQQKERLRLARELHDDLEGLRDESGEPTYTLAFAVERFRHLIANLRQPASGETELADALISYVEDYRTRTGLNAVLDLPGDALLNELSALQQTAVLRVVQEAMQNVYRHAQASQVRIALRFSPVELQVCVEDDGRGSAALHSPDRDSPHMGLVGMREWAEELDGELRVESWPGQGSRVVLAAPLQDPPASCG